MKYKKYWRKTSLKQKNIGDFFLKEISLSKPNNFLEIGIFQGVTARKQQRSKYGAKKGK